MPRTGSFNPRFWQGQHYREEVTLKTLEQNRLGFSSNNSKTRNFLEQQILRCVLNDSISPDFLKESLFKVTLLNFAKRKIQHMQTTLSEKEKPHITITHLRKIIFPPRQEHDLETMVTCLTTLVPISREEINDVKDKVNREFEQLVKEEQNRRLLDYFFVALIQENSNWDCHLPSLNDRVLHRANVICVDKDGKMIILKISTTEMKDRKDVLKIGRVSPLFPKDLPASVEDDSQNATIVNLYIPLNIKRNMLEKYFDFVSRGQEKQAIDIIKQLKQDKANFMEILRTKGLINDEEGNRPLDPALLAIQRVRNNLLNIQ